MSSFRFLGVAALAAVLAVPAAALAQQAPPAPAAAGAPMPGQAGRHHGHRNPMRAALGKLNLSDSQKTQIDQILAQSRGANRNADPATRKANREKMHAQIEGILTPAQRTQLRQEMQQMRQRHAHRGGNGTGPMPGASPTH